MKGPAGSGRISVDVEQAEATRRLTTSFLALGLWGLVGVAVISVVEIALAREDVVAPALRWSAVLTAVAAAGLLLRGGRAATVYPRWCAAYLGISALTFGMLGLDARPGDPSVHGVLLVPLGTILLVAPFWLRGLIGALGPAVAVMAYLRASGGTPADLPDDAQLLNFVTVLWWMAMILGGWLRTVHRTTALRRQRVAQLIDRRKRLLNRIAHEMHEPLERARAALHDLDVGDPTTRTSVAEQFDGQISRIEELARQMLGHLRSTRDWVDQPEPGEAGPLERRWQALVHRPDDGRADAPPPSFDEQERRLTFVLARPVALSIAALALAMWITDPFIYRDHPGMVREIGLWRATLVGLLLLATAGATAGLRWRWNPYPLWAAFFAASATVSLRSIGAVFPDTHPALAALCLMPFLTCFLVAPLPARLAIAMVGAACGALGYLSGSSPAAGMREHTDFLLTLLGLSLVGAVGAGHLLREVLRQAFADSLKIDAVLIEQRRLLEAVSHEIRTPLARARFGLELLTTSDDPAARARRIADLHRHLDELEDLARETGSYVGHAERPLPRDQAFDLRVVLERCALEWTPERPGVSLRGLEAVPSVIVRGSRRGFARAIGNLVRNATRYAEHEVQVQVRVEASGLVRIEVSDDGPGIPASERSRVFQPFARVDPSRTRGTGGLGLGLAIAHRIVEQHGGSIVATESPTGGARFVTTWPTLTGL